jgi:fibronectin-binding autotransporter adhesin
MWLFWSAALTGKTTGLSVLGADDGGESNLKYAWSSSGPATVSFSANNTNAAKNVTATFAKAGQYAFVVTITDAGGLSVTSSVSVTVSQTLTSITVMPATATVAPGQRQQFTATAFDQFGAALSSQPSLTWAASGGTIASGLFTAGATAGGPFTVMATKSGVSGTATVTVSSSPSPPPPPPPPPAPRQRVLVLGTDAGTAARVQVLDATTRQVISELSPFAGFSGGVRVAAGDVTGDGVSDVIAGAGSGGGSQVSVFDGATSATLFSFVAFAGFNGPVSVALGDVTGDGRADLIVGAPVNGHVKAFDGATGATFRSFLAFQGFSGSVAVGAGDLNGDGREELIVGAAQNGHVKAFSAIDNALVQSFLAYAGFSGSTTVAGGDLDGDGRAEIITGAGAAATHVKAFDGVSRAEEASFIAFPGAPYGVRVGAADVNGDGKDDVLAAPGGPVPQVKLFDGATLHEIDSFFALAATGGVGVFLGGSR